jgi:hypothetical protein
LYDKGSGRVVVPIPSVVLARPDELRHPISGGTLYSHSGNTVWAKK